MFMTYEWLSAFECNTATYMQYCHLYAMLPPICNAATYMQYCHLYAMLPPQFNSSSTTLWVLACSIISFYCFLSCALCFQFFTPIFIRSFLTSSSHLNLGLPFGIVAYGFHLYMVLATLMLPPTYYNLSFINWPTFSLLIFISVWDIYIHASISRTAIINISHVLQIYTFIMYFQCERADLDLNSVHNFSCISKRPGDGAKLEPKHVVVKELIKSGVVCDWCGAYTCEKNIVPFQGRCWYLRL
jgi:hypothetical protein